jgi:predicted O-linked N-acetylglucosamine transferase (SPINDLY family)
LIKELSGERFRTYVLAIPPARDDQTARLIREHADASVQLPESLDGARRAIADLELDVLYYQDIGMDPGSYVLAHSRLAPVQCASFGHPDTSGIETIDYWVSSDLFETPGSEAHYSERLYCLKGVGNLAYYGRPLLTQSPKSRADFGLDASKHLYLCPQTLFKMHPAFDEVLAEILRQDGDGTVALIASKCSHWVDLLQARFRRTIGPAADRIIFLPQQGGQDFLNLIALADVMLDTVHFNGYNTNLEAFSMGTPVVTMPTTFQRGRHTAGMYRRMGLDDLISKDVADYVAQALRLARDVNYRTEARRRILENCHVLYEDRQFVNEFERFFEFACAEQRHAARTLN